MAFATTASTYATIVNRIAARPVLRSVKNVFIQDIRVKDSFLGPPPKKKTFRSYKSYINVKKKKKNKKN